MHLTESGVVHAGSLNQSTKSALFKRMKEWPSRLAFLSLLLILIYLPIPMGSARLWAVSVAEIAIFLVTALCIACWVFSLLKLERPLTGIIFCFLLWSGWIIWITVQTQAMDLAKVEVLSPHRAELQQRLIDAEFSSEGERLPLSVDVGATTDHLLETLAYGCLFFCVIFLTSASRKRLRIVLWVILLSALLQSIYGSLMLMSGIEWGFWGEKEFYLGSATGTFVNRNHFAGYLEMGIAAGVGLILCTRSGRRDGSSFKQKLIKFLKEWDTRVLFSRIAVAVLFVGLILSQSRMGNAAALGGLGLAGLLYLLAKPKAGASKTLGLFISILILDIWIIGGWFGLDELVERYESTEMSTDHRAKMWPDLKEMIHAYQWTGSGLGTFKVAYPEFHSKEVIGSNSHAHNDYAQFLIETGRIGVLILSVLVIATLLQGFRVLRNRRNKTYTGIAFAGMMAMCSIAIHSVTDFNLQIPANAATLVALMACVWACNPNSNQKRTLRKK